MLFPRCRPAAASFLASFVLLLAPHPAQTASLDDPPVNLITPAQKTRGQKAQQVIQISVEQKRDFFELQVGISKDRHDKQDIGYSDVSIQVYDDQGEEILLKIPDSLKDRYPWIEVVPNSFGSTAVGIYRMTPKEGRQPRNVTLTFKGEKYDLTFGKWEIGRREHPDSK